MATKMEEKYKFVESLTDDDEALYYNVSWGEPEAHDGLVPSTIVRTPMSTRLQEVLDMAPTDEDTTLHVFLELDVKSHVGNVDITGYDKQRDIDKIYSAIRQQTGYMATRPEHGEKLAFCGECDRQIPPSEVVAGYNLCEGCDEFE